MRATLRGLAAAIALTLALIGSLAALLASESGTRWLVAQGERVAPFEFRVERVAGTLFTELQLDALHLELPEGPSVALDQGRLAVRAGSLLRGELQIPIVAAAGLRIDLPPADPEPASEPFTLPDTVHLPLGIHLDALQVDALELRQAGDPLASITRITARARAHGSAFELDTLELDMPEVRTHLTGRLDATGRYPLQLEGYWQAPLPEGIATGLGVAEARGEWSVSGALHEHVQLEHVLRAGIELRLRAAARELLATPDIDVAAHWEPFTYHSAEGGQDVAVEPGQLSLNGTPEDWTLTLDAAAKGEGWPRTTLATRARGSLDALEIESLTVDSAAGRATLSGPVQVSDPLEWDLRLEIRELDPAPLGLELDARLERLDARLDGRLQPAADTPLLAGLQAALVIDHLTGQYAGEPWQGQLHARLAEGQLLLEDTGLSIDNSAQLEVSGLATGLGGDLANPEQALDFDFGLGLRAPRLSTLHPELDGHIEQLQIALGGHYTPASGALEADLRLDPLRAQLRDIDIGGGARIALNEGGGQIKHLELTTGDGTRVGLRGDLDWSAGLAWDLALEGTDVDPALIVAEAPGRLTLALESRGRLDADTPPELEARLQRLEGHLRAQPVAGQGRLQLAGEHLTLDALELTLGANRLTADGAWDEVLDLALELDAPELERVWPDLAGRLQLDARVTGEVERPHLEARGTGTNLRLGDHHLQRLELAANAGFETGAPAEMDLNLSGIELADGLQVEALRLGADGRIDAHHLNLTMTSAELGSLDLSLQGWLDPEPLHWSGELTRLDLAQPAAGTWGLVAPAALEAGAEAARLEPLCLARADGRLCAEGRWHAQEGAEFAAALDAVDLAWLEPFLPPEIGIQGRLSAEASGQLDAQGLLTADLAVTPEDGHLIVRDDDGDLEPVPYRDARLTARVRDRNVDAALHIDFLEGGTARSDLRLRAVDDNLHLDGDFVARLDNLGWLAGLSPEIQRLRGALDARLEFGGRLDAPLVEGAVRFRDGGVLIPEAGIDVGIPELTANVISAERMELSGRLESGPGRLDLNGGVDLGTDGPRVQLALTGTDFLVVDRTDAEARITPDLQLGFSPEAGIRVRGEVLLPWARIRPPDLPPGSIRVSGDEIVIGEQITATQGLATDIRIRIRLGDDVRFDGFGLTARFAGEVDVEEVTGRPTQLFGEIGIPEGQYSDYGQDLSVERGSLAFQGPAETPELDLRAVRTVREHNVTVGLEIRGTPDNLRSRVISDPPMDETEAMAFLLTGRPLSGASQSDGNMIANAAAAYGLEQGAVITERIGRELGLDEVTLDTEGGLDESALTLGLYLSPRLLLRYSIGLFDNTSKVLLRYELTRNLSVETTSGTAEQSVDLIYRIER
ncbi:translocation/assembly module TamB domain-containing protein [Thioalkalivibrio sp. ALJT]|uniref:translocation/assembly module TamB domain-containing protein n=1 Tax=Thioalkalivibrio sp. ALJT TaxID=1158146 RepID=UPI00047784F9|nr:translocation/assembly module TamB domain-containing protein [Thioalkalivibrio sp. ALJT]